MLESLRNGWSNVENRKSEEARGPEATVNPLLLFGMKGEAIVGF